MWVYEKRLQYPVNITQTNAKLAQVIISQFGGPDGELAASQRYLSQRYTMPDGMTKGLLNDIGTEELAHIEIVCAIIYQLTKNLSVEEIKASGFDKYYVDHTLGIWPQAAGGIPFNACVFQVKGDPSGCKRICSVHVRLVHSDEPCRLCQTFAVDQRSFADSPILIGGGRCNNILCKITCACHSLYIRRKVNFRIIRRFHKRNCS